MASSQASSTVAEAAADTSAQTSKYSRADGAVSSEVDGAMIVLSPSTAEFIELNLVASRIWDLLAPGQVSVSAMVEMLMQEFDVPRARCNASVVTFLGQAEAKGMVTKS